ncbi:MAG: ammonia-forming cytochrome c nitrite reductase subunit c552 [Bryobacteraceae bacterium]
MLKRRRTWIVLVLAAAAHAASAPGYSGAAACAKCHAGVAHQWAGSRHSKMVQPATRAAVRGDFTAARVVLRGSAYGLSARNGSYYVTESDLTGKPREHRVDYTLGNRRIQHYLTTLADGRIIVLPPSWDIQREQWFHNADVADPEDIPGVAVQLWNKSCYSCHVSQQQKNFDVATLRYRNAWIDFGANCERCHGPGSQHVADYSTAVPPKGPVRDIVLQTRLDAARNTMVCAQCHSFRDIYVDGFRAGDDYYDHFLPILEYSLPDSEDPAFWPDGSTRRFSNDSMGLWQSQCYLKGRVTCVGCHVEAHNTNIDKNPQLRPDANALCTHCHESIGQALAAHTHHAPASTGSSCVECHMPRTVLSIKAQIRDHSMSIPVPENTIRHGIPNACNNCHKDRDARWTLAAMTKWYGSQSRQKLIRRADAFAAARRGDEGAIPALLDIFQTSAEGPLPRANALGYLTRFASDPRVYPAMSQALRDPEPLVRAVAATRMAPGQFDRTAAVESLVHALGDAAAIVRIGALTNLVSLGIRELPGEDGARFGQARQLFLARAALGSDDAEQQSALGTFFLLTAAPDDAVRAFENSLRLDPSYPAQYLLAGAYAEKNDLAQASKILLAIPPGDPQYDKSQRLLRVIEARTASH